MSDPSGYEDVLDLDRDGATDPQQPNESRDDYLVRVKRSQIRGVQDKAKRTDVAEQRVTQLERENAFLRAGVDTTTDAGKLLFNGYDGDLTPEAIGAAAVLLNQPAPAPEGGEGQPAEPTVDSPPEGNGDGGPQLWPGEADAANESTALAAGAPGDQPPTNDDPYDAATKLHDRALGEGAQQKQALGGAIHSLVQAAHNGDQRVILDRSGRQRGT